MKASEQIDLAIIVKKQSQTGIFKNQRLLLIKSGFISYFSNIPKYYVGNIRSIQLSGQLPKMTLSAAEIESIERRRKYIHMKFNKKHLINMEKFKGYMEGDEGKTKGNKMGDEIQQWIFKCENVEEAELFIKQIMYYKSDPTHKPELAKAINGYKDGKKGFRPSSIRLPSPSTSGFANRYSEQPSMVVNKERPNAIFFDEKQLNNKTIDILKNIENVIPENTQQQQLSEDDKNKRTDQKKQQSQIKNQEFQKIPKMQIQQVNSNLIKRQVATQQASFILPEKNEYKESKQTLIMMPAQMEDKSTYSREKFPYYPYLKGKKSSKKQQLKQLSLKQARLSGKKLLDKLSSNKIIPTNSNNSKILKINKEKSKLRLEKRSHTLQTTTRQEQVEEDRAQQKKQGVSVKRNSSWSELKRLKRSFSLIESILQNNCAQKLDKQVKQDAQKLIAANNDRNHNDHGIYQNLKQAKEEIKTSKLDGESIILDYQPNQDRKEVFEQKKQEDCPKISETFGESNTFKTEQSVFDLSKMLDNFTKLDETSISGDQNNNFEADSFFNSDQKQQHFKYHMSKDYLPLIEDQKQIQSPIDFKSELKSIVNSGGKLKQTKESAKSGEEGKVIKQDQQKNEQRIDVMKSLEKLLQVERLKLNQQLLQEQRIKINKGMLEKKDKIEIIVQIQQERGSEQTEKIQRNQEIVSISPEITTDPSVRERQQKQSERIRKTEKMQSNMCADNELKIKEIDNVKQQIQQKFELINQQDDKNKASPVQNFKNGGKNIKQQQLQVRKLETANTINQNAEEDTKQESTYEAQTYKSSNKNSIAALETIKEQEGTSELNSENSIKEQIKDPSDSISEEKDDDCISFKNLQIKEPEKYMPQPESLTPRFWQQAYQQAPVMNMSKKKGQQKNQRERGKAGSLLMQQKQIKLQNFDILNRERERKRTLVEKEQAKKQCYRLTQRLLNEKTQNKVGQTVRKIVKKMIEKSELQIPVQISFQLLQLKKQNELKKIAVDLMIFEVDHSPEQDSQAIMFGARRKWKGWCLFVYQSYATYSSVIKFYKELMSQIDKNLPNETFRIPHIYRLSYKGKYGIFIQAQQQCFNCMVPKRIEPVLKKILGQQFYERHQNQISIYENNKNGELIVWVNPDYLHDVVQAHERNWQRRVSWFDTLNSAIEQSSVQSFSELAACAWEEYLQESKRKQTVSAGQKIQILKILFRTYFLTLKSGISDEIEVDTFCSVTNLLNEKQKKQSQCYIDTLYKNLFINKYTQQEKRDILIFKAIKIINESQVRNGQLELVELQHFLLTLAEFFLTKQLFQQSYQIICYCLSLLVGEQVLALNMNQINLTHTKLLLISLGSHGKIMQIYKGFLRNLFLHFYCYSRLCNQKGSIKQQIDLLKGTVRMLQQIIGLAQDKQVSQQQNKQLINQITYHKILTQEVFLCDQETLQSQQFLVCLDEQKVAAQFLIQKSECIDKFSLTAFNAILKYLDRKIQLSYVQEAAQIASKLIDKLKQMHGSRQQINELLTQLKCRLDIRRIHNNSNTLAFSNFIQYLKFYITHFNQTDKISSNLPFFETSNKLSMIRRIVEVVCFKFCCNDFTSICCLIQTLKTLNLAKEELKQLLKQGWSMIEPEIRKRVQNKGLL